MNSHTNDAPPPPAFDAAEGGDFACATPPGAMVGAGEMREIVVDAQGAGLRLDTFLARRLTDRSRTFFQNMIEEGHVTVDGRAKPCRFLVAEGHRIAVHLPPPEDPWPRPQPIELSILYEDDQIVVINKPAGMVVHPAAGNPDGTLVNALLYHCRDLSGIGGVKRPGIVHRLDRDTSGVMVAAKTDAAHHSLSRQLQRRTMGRRYVTLAIGNIAENERTIDAPIGRDTVVRIRRGIGGEGARSAVTHLRILRRAETVTLAEARLETGRTHQIRVHLRHIGHPVLGDDFYGGSVRRVLERLRPGSESAAKQRAALSLLQRPFLHAWRLDLGHPTRGGHITFTAPLPPPLPEILDAFFGVSELSAFLPPEENP